MSAFDDMVRSDAHGFMAVDGTPIEYRPGGDAGAAITVNVIPAANPIDTRATDGQRTLAPDLAIAVAKADVPAPMRNSDTVVVPPEWIGRPVGGDNVELRVSSIEQDAADAGIWILGIG